MRYCSKEEARHILCRYHNLDGAEPLCGKEGVEAIMQRIHSIQYDPLNVVARNADLVLQASTNSLTDMTKRCVSTARTISRAYDMCGLNMRNMRFLS